MRLINADAFIRRLREACKDKATRMIVDKICVFVEVEATFHPVDTEPVRYGKWIYEPKDAIEMMFTKPKCSECGYVSADGMYYCSYCGARMIKE